MSVIMFSNSIITNLLWWPVSDFQLVLRIIWSNRRRFLLVSIFHKWSDISSRSLCSYSMFKLLCHRPLLLLPPGHSPLWIGFYIILLLLSSDSVAWDVAVLNLVDVNGKGPPVLWVKSQQVQPLMIQGFTISYLFAKQQTTLALPQINSAAPGSICPVLPPISCWTCLTRAPCCAWMLLITYSSATQDIILYHTKYSNSNIMHEQMLQSIHITSTWPNLRIRLFIIVSN